MRNLKKKFSKRNKLIIYQLPLIDRIMLVCSAIMLTSLPLIGLLWLDFNNDEKRKAVILLLAMILYSIYIYFMVFKLYICFDFNKKKLIIREGSGIKKEQIDISKVKEIKYLDGKPEFTIDIICNGFTKRIISWSRGANAYLIMFNRYKRQKRRLLKFVNKCN